MPVDPRFQDRPVIPQMAEGLAAIWQTLHSLCPDQAVRYDAAFPGQRENLERVNLPAVAGLMRHRRHREEYVLLQSYAHVAGSRNAATDMVIQQGRKCLLGQENTLDKATEKLGASIALLGCLRMPAEAIVKSKDSALKAQADRLLLSDGEGFLASRAARIGGLPIRSMTVAELDDVVDELERSAPSDEAEEGTQ